MYGGFALLAYSLLRDLNFGSLLDCLQIIFSKIILPFPKKSHECALKLTDLWIRSSLFDLNY